MVTRVGVGALVVAGHAVAIVVGLLGGPGLGLSALAAIGLLGLLVIAGAAERSTPTGPSTVTGTPNGTGNGNGTAAGPDSPIGGAVSEG